MARFRFIQRLIAPTLFAAVLGLAVSLPFPAVYRQHLASQSKPIPTLVLPRPKDGPLKAVIVRLRAEYPQYKDLNDVQLLTCIIEAAKRRLTPAPESVAVTPILTPVVVPALTPPIPREELLAEAVKRGLIKTGIPAKPAMPSNATVVYRADGKAVGWVVAQPEPITTYSALTSFRVAENGSYYGEISYRTGSPKTTYVRSYTRQDGTYVRSHYRSR